ncbi:MAG: CDP-glycerol:glycerophosphate glycerophosphotransferase [Anaerolineaceae bacterium]|nr:MAG: CDP-glycerol:glycerophosphate glycerophosphotransferase [Anaerolineaceae bacterium]
MRISVIMPFHKGLHFLEDALESLRDQSFKDFEVLLICDHVGEDIDRYIDEYGKDLDLKVAHLEDKSGVAAARNLGLSMARGDYIYFLDSDDYLDANALEQIVTTADGDSADVVYGKKTWTWFQRSLFLRKLYDEEDEEEEEDESDDGDSNKDNDSEDSDGNPIKDSSISDESDDDTNNEQSDDKEATQYLSEEEYIESKKRSAFHELVTRRKSVRSITVLHVLIRRQLIEDNNIRFNENIIFLSDYPFLLQVLDKAYLFSRNMESLYIKRNHNDSINFPSLGQMKGSKSFAEYISTYEYAKTLIASDSDLRRRLDRKIIYYTIRYFAPKLKRKKDSEAVTTNFYILHDLISKMDDELILSYKKYKFRILKAFYKGNHKKAKRIVTAHLARRKARSLIKNKRELPKFLYRKLFLKTSLKDNWVFCESFFGKSYSDSPKYVYEYLQKNYPGKYKFIWVDDKKGTVIPYKHSRVKRFSIRYCYYLARCKYYIFNSRQPVWIKKREGNVFLQTWHGTPLKRLVFDLEDINSATPRYKKQTYRQSRSWDYLVAANKYSSDIFKRCFIYNKTMLETGYPRNDIMHWDNKDEIASQLREKLGIPKDKKTILYAPTWRDDEYYTKGQYKFTLKLDLQLLKEELGDEYVILLRTHYFIADSIDVTGLEDFAFNFSNYDDISELYLISDYLITDYSSVFFDYANLKRPMLFYTYDLEKYRDVLRGFYIDIEEELPGPLLFTTEDIIDAFRNMNEIIDKYKEKYDIFYDKFCAWEDGQASRKVANAVFGLEDKIKK